MEAWKIALITLSLSFCGADACAHITRSVSRCDADGLSGVLTSKNITELLRPIMQYYLDFDPAISEEGVSTKIKISNGRVIIDIYMANLTLIDKPVIAEDDLKSKLAAAQNTQEASLAMNKLLCPFIDGELDSEDYKNQITEGKEKGSSLILHIQILPKK